MKKTVALAWFFFFGSVVAALAEETPALSIPKTIQMKTSSATSLVFDAGPQRPATLEYTIEGVEGTFKAGELVTLKNGVSLEVVPAPLLQVSGPGLGDGTFCLAVAPNNHNLMFFAAETGGTFRSTDGGKSWRVLPDLEGLHVGPGPQFLLDQKTIVWPGKADGGGTDKVCVSTDTGVTWISVPIPLKQITIQSRGSRYNAPICAVPFRHGLLLGTKLEGLLFFDPADMSFTPVDGKMDSDADRLSRGIWAVQVDGDTIYYITGKELREKQYRPETKDYSATVVKYTAPEHILGFGFGNGTFLMSVLDDGVYKSSDGKDFSKIYDFDRQTWFTITPTGTMYMAAAWHTAFYASDIITWSAGAVADKPLLQSVDGGKSWTNVFNPRTNGNVERTWIQKDLSRDSYFMWNGFCVLPGKTADTDVLFVTTSGEMFRSDDGGGRWTAPYREYLGLYMDRERNGSVGAETTTVWGCAENPHDPNILHGCWAGLQGQVSPDKGKTWVWAGKSGSVYGSTKETLYGVAFDPNTPGWVAGAWGQTHSADMDDYAAGVTGQGGVSISTDYGLTWNQPYRPRPEMNLSQKTPTNANCTGVAYDHVNGILYATFYNQRTEQNNPNVRSGGVWKSTDQGRTWKCVHNGYPENASPSNLHYTQIKLDDQQNVYVLMTLYSPNAQGGGAIPGGLWKSTDKGETWELLGPKGPAGTEWSRWPLQFTFGATAAEIYVACADTMPGKTTGLAVTLDGGTTWRSLWGRGTPGARWDYITTVYVEGNFILIGGTENKPRFSYNKGRTWQSWTDFPYNHITEVTKLSDGRYAFSTFGHGILFGQLPDDRGGALGHNEGVLHVTNPNKVKGTLNLTFTLTGKEGFKKTAKTAVRMM